MGAKGRPPSSPDQALTATRSRNGRAGTAVLRPRVGRVGGSPPALAPILGVYTQGEHVIRARHLSIWVVVSPVASSFQSDLSLRIGASFDTARAPLRRGVSSARVGVRHPSRLGSNPPTPQGRFPCAGGVSSRGSHRVGGLGASPRDTPSPLLGGKT